MNASIVSAICYTLFHSLWEGAITAFIAGIIILSTRKSSPALRYNLLLFTLGLFIIGIVFTFIITLTNSSGSLALIDQNTVSYLYPNDVSFTDNFSQLIRLCQTLYSEHTNDIVLIWCLVIFYKTMGLTTDILNISKIKKRQVSSAGEYWNDELIELSNQLGITKYVQLLQSGIARVPQTIGYFKPVILIPAGLVNTLPAGHLRVILLHELAHIRRNDYLINIVQSVIEILFFFNPAIWWISALLKSERENCCDDIVVKQAGDKVNYLNALISFHEMQDDVSQYSTALTGTTDSLLNRAKRIISNRNKTLHVMEKTILATTLLLTATVAIAFRDINNHFTDDYRQMTGKVELLNPPDLVSTSYSISDTIPNQKAKPSLEDSSLILSKIHKEAMDLKLQAQHLQSRAEEARALAQKSQQDREQQMYNEQPGLADQMRDIQRQMEMVQEQMKKNFSSDKKFNKEDLAALSKDLEAQTRDIKRQMEISLHDMEAMNLQMKKIKELGEIAKEFNADRIQSEVSKAKAEADAIKVQTERLEEKTREKERSDKRSKSDHFNEAD